MQLEGIVERLRGAYIDWAIKLSNIKQASNIFTIAKYYRHNMLHLTQIQLPAHWFMHKIIRRCDAGESEASNTANTAVKVNLTIMPA